MNLVLRRFLIVVIGVVYSSITFAEQLKSSAIPAGFESFFEPQTTSVDIYFGGVYKTALLATYTPSDIKFLNPNQLLDAIGNIAERAVLLQKLQQPMELNEDYVCENREQQCPELTTADIAVIFDESKFRADIIINSKFLVLQQLQNSKFLPNSTSAFSYQTNFNIMQSGDSYNNSRNLRASSFISSYNQHLHMDWEYSDSRQQQFNISKLYWQRDANGWQQRLGNLQSSNRFMDMLNSQDYIGASIATSYNTRSDLSFITATPLDFYISNKSRIDIIRDGIILSSKFYEAGNIVLDTSSLPEGAYNIEVKINGINGASKSTQRFFVKSMILPPQDVPNFYFEIGKLQKQVAEMVLPKAQTTWLARTALAMRVGNNLGWDSALAYTDNSSALETGLLFYNQNYTYKPKILIGNKGEYGAAFYGYQRLGKSTLNFNAYSIWRDKKDQLLLDSLIPNAAKRFSAGISVPAFNGNAALSWSRTEDYANTVDDVWNFKYQRILWKKDSASVDVSLDLQQGKKTRQAVLNFEWQQLNNNVQHSINLNTQYAKTEQAKTIGTLTYQGDTQGAAGGATYNAHWQAAHNHESDSLLAAGGEYSSNYGRLQAEYNFRNYKNQQNSLYNINFSSSIVGNAERIAFGGAGNNTAALILDVEGSALASEFDVLVNERVMARSKVGRRLVLPVSAFQTYKIGLKDIGSEFIAFDNKPLMTTLYPGNVVSHSWRADKMIVLIGSLTRGGQAVANARINGIKDWSSTDSAGGFQIEIAANANQQLSAQTLEYSCAFSLPKLDLQESIQYIEEPLECVDIE